MTTEPEREGGLPPQAMLTVAAVARRLGVAPSTLRTWDRRYGLGPSAHTAGSHRRYSPTDIGRLGVMRGLVMEGVPPAEAAQIALGTSVDDGREPGAPVVAPPAAPAASGAASESGAPASGPFLTAVSTEHTAVGEPPGDSPPAEREVSAASAMPTTSTPEAASRPGPWPGPARAPRSGHPGPGRGMAAWAALAAASVASAVTGVPASRAVPPPEGGPAGGAGRTVWPANPLAAQHLLRSVGELPGPTVDRELGEALEPLDDGLADGLGAGLDAALAKVIDDAMGRTLRTTGPTWTGPVGRAGGGRVISLPDASPQARGLARAAMSLDTHELTRLLRDAVGAYGVVGAWNTMVAPVLRGLGERWQATGEGIDVEHAFSEATIGVLRGVAASLSRPRNARPVLLACADGDQHSLPLHVLSAALAEVEVGCRLLGVGMPGRALVAATRRTGPAVVLVYGRMPVADATALREFQRQRPAPRVLVGGPGWQFVDVPTSVVHVDSLQDAVDEVRAALRA